MRRAKLKVCLLSLALLIGGVCAVGQFSVFMKLLKRPQTGYAVPDFNLKGLGGKSISSAALKGQKYGLLFFRTGCSHCQKELTELNQLPAELSATLKLIPTALDDEQKTRAAKEQWGLSFDVYADGAALGREIGLVSVPMLVLVDEEGSVQYVQSGARSREFVEIVCRRFSNRESLDDSSLRAVLEKRTKAGR